MTVPTPTVSAIVGTLEISPSKYLALAMIVSFARVFTLVLETRLEPGSLKATWPSGPIPIRTARMVRMLISPQQAFDQSQCCNRLTSNKELDAPSSRYLFLKGCTFCLHVGGVAIKDVRVLCFYVYVLEEVIPHEGVVALRVISWKS